MSGNWTRKEIFKVSCSKSEWNEVEITWKGRKGSCWNWLQTTFLFPGIFFITICFLFPFCSIVAFVQLWRKECIIKQILTSTILPSNRRLVFLCFLTSDWFTIEYWTPNCIRFVLTWNFYGLLWLLLLMLWKICCKTSINLVSTGLERKTIYRKTFRGVKKCSANIWNRFKAKEEKSVTNRWSTSVRK